MIAVRTATPAGEVPVGAAKKKTLMFSETVLAGRLGRDPEIRTTSGGKKVATLRLCTSSHSKGTEFLEWHTVTAWGDGLVGLLEKHVHKGDRILVTGQNRTASTLRTAKTTTPPKWSWARTTRSSSWT